MKPKEKAESLVAKFNVWTSRNNNAIHIEYDAKQCALICVDEILEIMLYWHIGNDPYLCNNKKYYLEVKQEIEKL